MNRHPCHSHSIPFQRHFRINGGERSVGAEPPRGKIRWGPAAAGVGPRRAGGTGYKNKSWGLGRERPQISKKTIKFFVSIRQRRNVAKRIYITLLATSVQEVVLAQIGKNREKRCSR